MKFFLCTFFRYNFNIRNRCKNIFIRFIKIFIKLFLLLISFKKFFLAFYVLIIIYNSFKSCKSMLGSFEKSTVVIIIYKTSFTVKGVQIKPKCLNQFFIIFST